MIIPLQSFRHSCLSSMARALGLKGVEYTSDTPSFQFILSPAGNVRLSEGSLVDDMWMDLAGQHEIIHAKQLAGGDFIPHSTNLCEYRGRFYEVWNQPYTPAINLHSGQVLEIPPWEEEAMCLFLLDVTDKSHSHYKAVYRQESCPLLLQRK